VHIVPASDAAPGDGRHGASDDAARLRSILEIARDLGLPEDCIELHGHYKAKINLDALPSLGPPTAKVIVVTAMTPTPLGEGKTVNTIGLSLGLNRLGKRAVCAIRQPSLGPFFGVKGPANAVNARDVAVARALHDAYGQLVQQYGPDTSKWTWGTLHTATFEHPLATVSPLNLIFGVAPVVRPGDSVTVSVGVASYPGGGASVDDLLDAADEALHTAKTSGGNTVQAGNGR